MKIFNKIFGYMVIIATIILAFKMVFLNHTLTNNELYIGIVGIILYCTDDIINSINDNKQ